MELARLFASVGFKVEKDGLDVFRKEMAQLKSTLKEAATATGAFRRNLVGLNAQLKAFGRNIDPKALTTFSKRLTTAMGEFISLYQKNANMQKDMSKWADAFINNLARLHSAIQGRNQQIAEYAHAIGFLADNFQRLKEATAGIGRFRQVPSSALSQAQGGTMRPYHQSGGGGGRGDDGSNQYLGYWGRAGGFAKTPVAAFFRPIMPTGMGLFNAVAAGYGFKELVQTGREMMQLEVLLKAVSAGQADFNDNLEFTRSTANALGIDIQNLTESYAKFYLAGKPLFGREELQKAFTGSQSYFRLLGMTTEKIKLANKAIEQMMNKQRVNAEELKNQLAEHATGALQFFADVAAGGSVQQLFKLMEEGKVSVDAVVAAMQRMGEFASKNPEFDRMLKMSGAEQTRFENEMKLLSKSIMESGLDEVLAEIFVLLRQIVTILSPFTKAIAKALKGLGDMAQVLWENKAAVVALMGAAALGGLGWLFIKAGLSATTFTGIIRTTTASIWAMYGAMIRLMALFGSLVYLFTSYNEWMGGEDNWIHAIYLSFQIVLAYTESFYWRMLAYIEGLKTQWSGMVDTVSNNPVFQFLSRAVNVTTSGVQSIGQGIGETAGKFKMWYDRQEHLPDYGDIPAISQNRFAETPRQVTNMNFTIDVSNLPAGVSVSAAEAYGNAVGTNIAEEMKKVVIPFRATMQPR